MYHLDWFRLRFELTRDYPGCSFDVGRILEASEFEGKAKLDEAPSINPYHFKDHFRKLRWWEHRTIEQLLTLSHMKVTSNGGGYWRSGDVAPVTEFNFNDESRVGGKGNLLFSLKGHWYSPSQVEPATKEEYETFKSK